MPEIQVEPLPKFHSAYTLGSWLISGPFHPLWDQWVATLAHLRGEVDGEPPKLQFDGATHELLIVSVHPDRRLNANSDPSEMRSLQPIDVCQQFTAVNDADALKVVDEALELVEAGQLSPDMDFRPAWEYVLRGD